MGELYNPFPKLPKNIRQIGERDQIVKLYVEDYVNTYLKRLRPAGGQELRVGLLLGNVELNDGTPYIFIDGAMEIEEAAAGQQVEFTEQTWINANQNLELMFPKRSITGWFLCGVPGSELSPLNYWKQHVQYFQGPNKLMYLNGGEEGDESIYITSEDGFYKLCGYSVYYERNQMMQDYMVLRKDAGKIEAGTDEKVVQEFRKRLDDRRDQSADRHQTLSLLRGMCTAMSVVILAGGIVMFNNYQKMREMESVIASAVPKSMQPILLGEEGGNKGSGGMNKGDGAGGDKPETRVVIEEADGGVYPTSGIVMKETMPEGGEAPVPAREENAGSGNAGVIPGGEKGADESGNGNGAGAAGKDGSSAAGQAGGQTAAQRPAQSPGQPDGGAVKNGAGGGLNTGESKKPEVVQNSETDAGKKTDAASNTTPKQAAGQTSDSGQRSETKPKTGTGGNSGTGEKTASGGNSGSGENPSSGGKAAASQKTEAPKPESGNKPQPAPGAGNAQKDGGSAAAVNKAQRIHVVETGETLYSISLAEYHSVNRVKEICELNGLEDENKIIAGQKLLLPQ